MHVSTCTKIYYLPVGMGVLNANGIGVDIVELDPKMRKQ